MAELVRRINELEENLRNKSSDAERIQGERDTKEHETNSLKVRECMAFWLPNRVELQLAVVSDMQLFFS